MNKEFAEDFIALQSDIPSMPKDKSGYGYKYTDLDTIISVLKPLMKKHNIGFIQTLETRDGLNGINTTLLHKSGDSISGFVVLPSVTLGKTNNAQNEGAAITYFKRYALSAMFGISSDEDIDCSNQIYESNVKQAKAREEKKDAPTSNLSSHSLSDKTQKNNTKKADSAPKLFTPEQAQHLGELMETRDAKGRPLFSDKDKEHYRELLKSGLYKNAVEEATLEVKKRALTVSNFPQDNAETPDALF